MERRVPVMRTLCHKAWRESRSRFLLSAGAIIALLAGFILLQATLRTHLGETEAADRSYAGYVYLRVYGGFVRGLFTVLALILGLGGLQRERAYGTIGFTLALPVSRLELYASRILVGLAEVTALALLPVPLVPVLSRVIGETYPLAQCIEFAALWIGVGASLFAFSVLVSTLVPSDYAALALSLVAYFVYPLIVVYAPVVQDWPLHIHHIMNGLGMPYFDPAADLLVGPYPWAILAGAVAATLAMLASAARIVARQEFA
jgi:ABC-2 type transport system permease protein